MHPNIDINIVSKAENLRLYILEHMLQLEESVSSALGNLLDIEWKKSKSFGFGSTSLSFNQKVQIIQDLRNLDKKEVQKLTNLMIIRNKFAHVKSIETFQDLFNMGNVGKDLKRDFDKWYKEWEPEPETEFGDFENKYKFCFFFLYVETTIILAFKTVNFRHEEKQALENKIHLAALRKELLDFPGGKYFLRIADKKAWEEIEKVTAHNRR